MTFVWNPYTGQLDAVQSLLVLDARYVNVTGDSMTGDLSILNQKELRFYEGENYVGFEAPSLLANQIWVLPDVDGGTNDILVTDGAGNLSFVTLGSLTGSSPSFTDGSTLRWEADTAAWIASQAIIINDSAEVLIGDASNYTNFKTDGAIIFNGEAGLAFGEMYIDKDNTTATPIAVQNTWYQVTQFDNNGQFKNVTPDYTNDHILIDNPGRYLVTFSACVRTAVAGLASLFEFQIYKNNGATAFGNLATCRNLSGGGGDSGSISISGMFDVVQNDTIELWVRNMTNTSDIIFKDANLTITQLAGT